MARFGSRHPARRSRLRRNHNGYHDTENSYFRSSNRVLCGHGFGYCEGGYSEKLVGTTANGSRAPATSEHGQFARKASTAKRLKSS